MNRSTQSYFFWGGEPAKQVEYELFSFSARGDREETDHCGKTSEFLFKVISQKGARCLLFAYLSLFFP